MSEVVNRTLDPAILKLSFLYRLLLIVVFALIAVNEVCLEPQILSAMSRVLISSCFVFMAFVTSLAIYGEIKGRLLLQLPHLIVQFFFSSFLIFFELFIIVYAIYYFIWLDYGRNLAERSFYANEFRASFIISLFLGVIAPLNAYLDFYVPLQRFSLVFLKIQKKEGGVEIVI